MKKMIFILLAFVFSLTYMGFMSGCDLIKQNASLVPKSYEDIADLPGFYVFNSGKFYSPYSSGASFEKGSIVTDITDLPYRYIWFQEDKAALIPTVSSRDTSGLVYVNAKDLPDSLQGNVYLEYFEDKGYTVGIALTNKDNVFSFNTDSTCASSSASKKIKDSLSAPRAFVLSEINTTVLDDSMPLWDQNGVITSLEKDAKYMFSGYQGTVYKEIIMEADTHYFVSSAITQLDTTNIEKTKVGYFIIHMPTDSPSGLYCINSTSLFFYLNETDTIAKYGADSLVTTATSTESSS